MARVRDNNMLTAADNVHSACADTDLQDDGMADIWSAHSSKVRDSVDTFDSVAKEKRNRWWNM